MTERVCDGVSADVVVVVDQHVPESAGRAFPVYVYA